MRHVYGSSILLALAIGCSSRPAQTNETASTAGSESEASSQTNDHTAAGRPRVSGHWTVGGQRFTPESGVAVHRDDGSYEVVVASPAVDCEFVRHGGSAPEHLREIRMNVPWQSGVAVASSSSDSSGQVLFVYEAPSPFDPSRMTLENIVAEGTVTPSEAPTGPGATGTIQLAVDGPDPAMDAVHGEIDVVVCD